MIDNIIVNTQSSIKITGSRILYFDPYQIEKEENDADFIFLTHDHYDHYSKEDIEKVRKEDTLFIIPKEMKENFLRELNVEETFCTFVEPGEKIEFEGLEIKTIPAYNKVKPFHPKSKKYCGYLITFDHTKYYITGDTDALEENAIVSCDVLFLPIGGYYTMDVEEAVSFTKKIKPKVVIPTHYGTIVGKKEDGKTFQTLLKKEEETIEVELKLD